MADDVTSENLQKIMWLLMMLIGAVNKAGCYESFGSELYIADRLVQALTAVHRQVQYHVLLQVCGIQVRHTETASPTGDISGPCFFAHTEHTGIRDHATSNHLIYAVLCTSMQSQYLRPIRRHRKLPTQLPHRPNSLLLLFRRLDLLRRHPRLSWRG